MTFNAVLVGNVTIESYKRMAGTYLLAYDLTDDSGNTGRMLFEYEYDKRDVIREEVWVTPEIAESFKTFLDDDSPACFVKFPKEDEHNVNPGLVEELQAMDLVNVYSYS